MSARDPSECSPQGADGGPEKFSFQLSPLARAIVEMSRDDRASLKNLADVIVAEPLFGARLLRVAIFSSGLAQKPATIAQAINAFGMDHFKALAVGMSLFEMQSTPPKQDVLPSGQALITFRQLWEHSLGCAVLAGRLAAIIDHPCPHLVFVAGFLHDLGRVLFYRHWKEHFLETVALALDKNLPASEAEILGLGVSHAEFGARWASHAELPLYLQQAIRYHHEPISSLTDVVDAETAKVIALVQQADSECETHAIGRGGKVDDRQGDLWAEPKPPADDWAEQRIAIKKEIEASRPIFGFDDADGEPPDDPKQVAVKPATGWHHKGGPVNVQRRGQIIPFPVRPGNPRAEAGDAGAKDAETDKLTILVVEDHASLCEMLSLCFMRFGYHVRTASDGKVALEMLAREKIHLVLLDLMLPRVDGFAVLKSLRECQSEKLPYVIVVSAGASEKDRSKVLELGADEYMPKPFHLMRLLERVQTVEKYLL